MSDTAFERYQARRARKYLQRQEQTARWLPGWRTHARRRLLVVLLGVVFAAMIVSGVVAAFAPTPGVLIFAGLCLVFTPVWTSLQIVSDRGDSPTGALDERELAQRNEARSLALTVTQTLTLIPAFYLYLGSRWEWMDGTTLATSGSILVLACLLIGGCSATAVLAWTRPDPDPEDESDTYRKGTA
ncbi:hypothetical protein [Rhodococcoides kroppenstedtii]|uniref:hypothetical protein n=1 Tax=Rhodococcoides kroppenstedtii TaxID=293050 RepID=UPI0028F0D9F2|nr:hypothetical protein [Rhodococcus kroppenstedtii]